MVKISNRLRRYALQFYCSASELFKSATNIIGG